MIVWELSLATSFRLGLYPWKRRVGDSGGGHKALGRKFRKGEKVLLTASTPPPPQLTRPPPPPILCVFGFTYQPVDSLPPYFTSEVRAKANPSVYKVLGRILSVLPNREQTRICGSQTKERPLVTLSLSSNQVIVSKAKKSRSRFSSKSWEKKW